MAYVGNIEYYFNPVQVFPDLLGVVRRNRLLVNVLVDDLP